MKTVRGERQLLIIVCFVCSFFPVNGLNIAINDIVFHGPYMTSSLKQFIQTLYHVGIIIFFLYLILNCSPLIQSGTDEHSSSKNVFKYMYSKASGKYLSTAIKYTHQKMYFQVHAIRYKKTHSQYLITEYLCTGHLCQQCNTTAKLNLQRRFSLHTYMLTSS